MAYVVGWDTIERLCEGDITAVKISLVDEERYSNNTGERSMFSSFIDHVANVVNIIEMHQPGGKKKGNGVYCHVFPIRLVMRCLIPASEGWQESVYNSSLYVSFEFSSCSKKK